MPCRLPCTRCGAAGRRWGSSQSDTQAPAEMSRGPWQTLPGQGGQSWSGSPATSPSSGRVGSGAGFSQGDGVIHPPCLPLGSDQGLSLPAGPWSWGRLTAGQRVRERAARAPSCSGSTWHPGALWWRRVPCLGPVAAASPRPPGSSADEEAGRPPPQRPPWHRGQSQALRAPLLSPSLPSEAEMSWLGCRGNEPPAQGPRACRAWRSGWETLRPRGGGGLGFSLDQG